LRVDLDLLGHLGQHVVRGAAVHHAGARVARLEPVDQERDEDVVPLGRLTVEAADVIADAQLQAARDQSELRTVSAAWPMFRSLAYATVRLK